MRPDLLLPKRRARPGMRQRPQRWGKQRRVAQRLRRMRREQRRAGQSRTRRAQRHDALLNALQPYSKQDTQAVRIPEKTVSASVSQPAACVTSAMRTIRDARPGVRCCSASDACSCSAHGAVRQRQRSRQRAAAIKRLCSLTVAGLNLATTDLGQA